MGGCGRTLWFDKLCLRQSLDAKPIGGAPCKGESGEGNAARIYPSFSATIKKGTHRVPFLMVVNRRFDENPMVRPNATPRALGTEPRERRSPKGQNSPEAVLGNPSFSAKTKKRAY